MTCHLSGNKLATGDSVIIKIANNLSQAKKNEKSIISERKKDGLLPLEVTAQFTSASSRWDTLTLNFCEKMKGLYLCRHCDISDFRESALTSVWWAVTKFAYSCPLQGRLLQLTHAWIVDQAADFPSYSFFFFWDKTKKDRQASIKLLKVWNGLNGWSKVVRQVSSTEAA